MGEKEVFTFSYPEMPAMNLGDEKSVGFWLERSETGVAHVLAVAEYTTGRAGFYFEM